MFFLNQILKNMYFLGILGNNGIILHIYTCIITVFKIIIIIIIKANQVLVVDHYLHMLVVVSFCIIILFSLVSICQSSTVFQCQLKAPA